MRTVKTVAPVFSLKMLKLGSNRMREDICVASSVRTISPMRMMKLYREEFNVMDEVSEAFVGCVWMRFHFQFTAVKMHGYVGCGVSGCKTFYFSPKFFERSTQIAKKGKRKREKGRGKRWMGPASDCPLPEESDLHFLKPVWHIPLRAAMLNNFFLTKIGIAAM